MIGVNPFFRSIFKIFLFKLIIEIRNMYHQRMIFLPKEKMSEIPTIMDSSVLTEDRWTVYIPVAGLGIGDLDIEMNNDTITINCDMNYHYG